MDVDPTPGSSSAGFNFPSSCLLPKIEENLGENKPAKQRLEEILDSLEGHVEKLRKEAAKLEEYRDNLMASLDAVRSDNMMHELVDFERDEASRVLDRIMERCLTVEVKIHTQRDKQQVEALHQVNHLIDTLVMGLKTDPDSTKAKCVSYMNACSSHYVHGVTDKNFESAILGCTLDDQKRVKKRIQGLLNYFDRLQVSSHHE